MNKDLSFFVLIALLLIEGCVPSIKGRVSSSKSNNASTSSSGPTFVFPFGTYRVSLDSSAAEGNGNSTSTSVTADGRYAVFHSSSTNLVAGDTNAVDDVFLRDLTLGTTIRVSVDSSGTQGNGNSQSATISSDGRYVVFQSAATNLVAGDTNGLVDIFVRDLVAGTTTRVNTDSVGTEATGGNSSFSKISADGRYVIFSSSATNLVAGDTNGSQDIFLKDTVTGTTTRVSVDSSNTQSNNTSDSGRITPDGKYILFSSSASNLVAGDTNATWDIFVRDVLAGTTTRVSTDSAGVQANGVSNDATISADGRYVTFMSAATNLVAGDTNGLNDIFLKDTQTGTTTRVSTDSAGVQAVGGASSYPFISGDGRYVLFYSSATNLVTGDTNAVADVFVKDTSTGSIVRVNVDSSGTQSASAAILGYSGLSYDGQYSYFISGASDLVTGDTNGVFDIFVHRVW